MTNKIYTTSIRLSRKQREWFEKQSINFSDWVRKRIDEAMKKGGSDGVDI